MKIVKHDLVSWCAALALITSFITLGCSSAKFWTRGCSSTKVWHTGISGSVRSVDSWTIRLADTTTNSPLVDIWIGSGIKRSRFTHAEACNDYVERVKSCLQGEYQLPLSPSGENGVILIQLEGQLKQSLTVGSGVRKQKKDDLDYNTMDEDPFEERIAGSKIRYSTDRVTKVSLSLRDADGLHAGEIVIEGFGVQPKKVADVIYQLITRGKY